MIVESYVSFPAYLSEDVVHHVVIGGFVHGEEVVHDCELGGREPVPGCEVQVHPLHTHDEGENQMSLRNRRNLLVILEGLITRVVSSREQIERKHLPCGLVILHENSQPTKEASSKTVDAVLFVPESPH